MSLIPYEPFRHLENIRKELDHFFTSDFPSFRTGIGHHFGTPSIDIHETESEVVATCDIPGLESKEDVDIDVDQNLLTISGSVNRVNEIKDENMHRRERFVGRFQRSVELPCRVNTDGVKATYKNGVLEIRMPKMQGENKKKIDIQFH